MSVSALAIWPAIDLMSGRVVRLQQGEAEKATVYESDPVDVARRFEAEGADGVHVVDLDAAFSRGENRALVRAIVSAVKVPVEVGGGLRSRESIESVLGESAARVVLGSLPFTDPDLFEEIVGAHTDRLVVALDCRNGRPTTKGWTEDAGAGSAAAVAKRLASLDVRSLLVTDVARDGAMTGPNLDLLAEVRSVFAGEILASGGMRGAEDLAPVDRVLDGGPRGAIFGRAIHEGKTSVSRLKTVRVEAAR